HEHAVHMGGGAGGVAALAVAFSDSLPRHSPPLLRSVGYADADLRAVYGHLCRHARGHCLLRCPAADRGANRALGARNCGRPDGDRWPDPARAVAGKHEWSARRDRPAGRRGADVLGPQRGRKSRPFNCLTGRSRWVTLPAPTHPRAESLIEMAFQGSLKELPLPDIIQLVSVSGKTGKFTLSRESDRGYIYLKNGQMVHAAVGDLLGEEAIYALAIWNQGEFQFLPGEEADRQTITKSNTNL